MTKPSQCKSIGNQKGILSGNLSFFRKCISNTSVQKTLFGSCLWINAEMQVLRIAHSDHFSWQVFFSNASSKLAMNKRWDVVSASWTFESFLLAGHTKFPELWIFFVFRSNWQLPSGTLRCRVWELNIRILSCWQVTLNSQTFGFFFSRSNRQSPSGHQISQKYAALRGVPFCFYACS